MTDSFVRWHNCNVAKIFGKRFSPLFPVGRFSHSFGRTDFASSFSHEIRH